MGGLGRTESSEAIQTFSTKLGVTNEHKAYAKAIQVLVVLFALIHVLDVGDQDE